MKELSPSPFVSSGAASRAQLCAARVAARRQEAATTWPAAALTLSRRTGCAFCAARHFFHTKSERVCAFVQRFSEWTPWSHRVSTYVMKLNNCKCPTGQHHDRERTHWRGLCRLQQARNEVSSACLNIDKGQHLQMAQPETFISVNPSVFLLHSTFYQAPGSRGKQQQSATPCHSLVDVRE